MEENNNFDAELFSADINGEAQQTDSAAEEIADSVELPEYTEEIAGEGDEVNDTQPIEESKAIDESPIVDVDFDNDLSDNNIESYESEEANPQKGLIVFVIILCAVLALALSCVIGYYLGKSSAQNPANNSYKVQLADKPDAKDALTAEGVYDTVNPSVVGIAVYNSTGVKGYASGVVYSEDGYIITNDHIYEDVVSAKFKIYTYDGKVYDAEFIAGDTRSDLAVLKVDATGMFPATFGNSDKLDYGEQVYAIGRPNDAAAASSITGGYISFLNRRVSNATNYSSKLIQTDSAINPGSSGGALVNTFGQVVGITSSKLVGSQYEGVGYAIPTTTVKKIVESLITNREVIDRAKLGISYREIDAITAELNKTSAGLYVAALSGNPDLANKLEVGDVITSVNGIQITDADIVLDIIENGKPGDEITFGVQTNSGATKSIKTKLVADVSSSSYKTSSTPDSNVEELPKNDDEEGSFDFPYGY